MSYIVTLDELVAGLPSGVSQETTDASALTPLTFALSFLYPLRMWASTGFQPNGNLMLITLHSPSPCPDGTPRTLYDYISFLLSADLDGTIENLNTQLLGIVLTYTLSGNSIQLHASKA